MMNFIVSGQPKLGHESWPPPTDDKVLSDRLYGQRGAKERTRMEIKFEKIGDRLLTYYHFSKLMDVTSCLTDEEKKMNPPADHGRKGSFFVMSLRMDGYYSTDFSKIYTLLEEMYEKHVNGKVLKMSKEGYLVYQIMKLEEAKEIWENITSELKVRGENSFLKQTKPIPGDISIKGTKTSDYFSVEDTEKNIENVLIQKGGVFVISPNEMKARMERIKKQENDPKDDNPNGERITQHEFDAFVKTTEDVQELTSTTDKSISQKIKNLVLLLTRRNNADKEWLEKLTSLSEEQEIIIEKINAFGERIQIPSQNNDHVKKTWLPIVLIVLGLIGLWLCISVINLKGKVKTLVEQIDSLTVQIDSLTVNSGFSTFEMNGISGLQNNEPEKKSEGVVTVNNDGEAALITLLDLRKTDGTDVSNMRKGNSYVVTAKSGPSGKRKEAKGTGTFSCDEGENKGINWRQVGNKCYITVYEDATAKRVTLKYDYQLDNEEKSLSKNITIQ